MFAPDMSTYSDHIQDLCTHPRLNSWPHCRPAGVELQLLAEQLPADRRIVGIDLAKGMIDIASKRLSGCFLRCGKMFTGCK